MPKLFPNVSKQYTKSLEKDSFDSDNQDLRPKKMPKQLIINTKQLRKITQNGVFGPDNDENGPRWEHKIDKKKLNSINYLFQPFELQIQQEVSLSRPKNDAQRITKQLQRNVETILEMVKPCQPSQNEDAMETKISPKNPDLDVI